MGAHGDLVQRVYHQLLQTRDPSTRGDLPVQPRHAVSGKYVVILRFLLCLLLRLWS